MKTLLQTIDQYDRDQCAYIRDLETENDRQRAKIDELTAQLASYVATVDRMKFDLIVAGALVRPEPRLAFECKDMLPASDGVGRLEPVDGGDRRSPRR
jgi:hypothetical protein